MVAATSSPRGKVDQQHFLSAKLGKSNLASVDYRRQHEFLVTLADSRRVRFTPQFRRLQQTETCGQAQIDESHTSTFASEPRTTSIGARDFPWF
jgi:hypothetical protein